VEKRNVIRRNGPEWTITIPEGQTRRRLFEFAAWYQDLALEPGTYTLKWNPQNYRGFWSVSIPATITDSYFPAGFGGLLYPSEAQRERDAKDIGQKTTEVMHFDDYALRETEFEEEDRDIRTAAFYLDSIKLGLKTRHWETNQDTKHWDRLLRDVDTIKGILERYRKEFEE
jgi:hypothetical protein